MSKNDEPPLFALAMPTVSAPSLQASDLPPLTLPEPEELELLLLLSSPPHATSPAASPAHTIAVRRYRENPVLVAILAPLCTMRAHVRCADTANVPHGHRLVKRAVSPSRRHQRAARA